MVYRNFSRVLDWESNITAMVQRITTVYNLKFHAYAIIRHTSDTDQISHTTIQSLT